jgi:hypothetical protein
MHEEKTPRVKLLAAILYREGAPLAQCLDMLQARFSSLDFQGEDHPFTQTAYYQPEMGDGLMRRLVSFTHLVEPAALVQAKHAAREIEQALSIDGQRRVNVDMGYLDLFKLVLASVKGRGNKLYLSDGVWADMTLLYERGEFRPLPWSFPDFAAGTYNEDLRAIRGLLKAQHKLGDGE